MGKASAKVEHSIGVVHNPSAQEFDGTLQVQLPPKAKDTNWAVYMWQEASKTFEQVASQITEHPVIHNYGKIDHDWMLFAHVKMAPNSLAYIKIMEAKEQAVELSAKSDNLVLRSFDVSGFKFTYTDAEKKATDFTINVGMYHADQGEDDYPDSDNCAEGAYLFKPSEFERWQYNFFNASQDTQVTKKFFEGPVVNQWRFDLVNHDTKETGILYVNKHKFGLRPIEVELQLNGININDGRGKDSIMNFHFENFGYANKTFFTDSNGLEMQKRIIDYRPLWEYSGD